ncbi:MAG: zinc dependent phospholipase C family protein [Treponema sp.]|jgi:hypothetical protein|nr:zinc dependent phospholipase C family protein [Treponema sp.]
MKELKLLNHYKMAETIYIQMQRKDMRLKRLPFILGNLAPDLYCSFIFRRHEYDCSIVPVRKAIFRLYEGRFDPCSELFAYFMGVVCHYICDYFCYSHSPAFRGNLWDHIKYEWVQRMAEAKKISFSGQEGYMMGFHRLMDTLDEYVRSHDYDLMLDASAAQTDLSIGTAVAGWLTEAVFCSAEQPSSLPAAGTAMIGMLHDNDALSAFPDVSYDDFITDP